MYLNNLVNYKILYNKYKKLIYRGEVYLKNVCRVISG